MIKLTKTSSTEWRGNGFGTAHAEWCVKGFEHITVTKGGGASDWVARDTSGETPKMICKAWTKQTLLKVLADKLA